jgi:hypothetical protein
LTPLIVFHGHLGSPDVLPTVLKVLNENAGKVARLAISWKASPTDFFTFVPPDFEGVRGHRATHVQHRSPAILMPAIRLGSTQKGHLKVKKTGRSEQAGLNSDGVPRFMLHAARSCHFQRQAG